MACRGQCFPPHAVPLSLTAGAFMLGYAAVVLFRVHREALERVHRSQRVEMYVKSP